MNQSFRTKLNQIWVPAEFRLPEPEFTAEQLNILEELIQLMSPNFSDAEEMIKDEKLRTAHFLMELGTGIWRVRRKMESLSRMPKEIKDALYSLESIWMSMSDGGVEIIDHTGVMPSKHEAKIVEVRDTPGLAREQVIDTIKPTILIHGEVVQAGEVIVGRPVPPQDVTETMRSAVQPDEFAAPADIEPEAAETDEDPDAKNPAGMETASAEDVTGQLASDENENGDEPETETAVDEEALIEIEIPLPQKRTRKKGVLPASVKTKLAAIPEIGGSPADEKKEEETASKRGRRRASTATRKNVQTETGVNSGIDSGVREEET